MKNNQNLAERQYVIHNRAADGAWLQKNIFEFLMVNGGPEHLAVYLGLAMSAGDDPVLNFEELAEYASTSVRRLSVIVRDLQLCRVVRIQADGSTAVRPELILWPWDGSWVALNARDKNGEIE